MVDARFVTCDAGQVMQRGKRNSIRRGQHTFPNESFDDRYSDRSRHMNAIHADHYWPEFDGGKSRFDTRFDFAAWSTPA
ncbi:hypothetical protein [Burkholderia gladioli]|uniref:hypothetical protein n=1 Tax=Burkholderia gladioli TaxID=28095 RepID=UPI00163FB59D|nr:hypothetical protein [Burkholderia gladioli]